MAVIGTPLESATSFALQNLKGKNILLKTPHTSNTKLERIELGLTWKPPL